MLHAEFSEFGYRDDEGSEPPGGLQRVLIGSRWWRFSSLSLLASACWRRREGFALAAQFTSLPILSRPRHRLRSQKRRPPPATVSALATAVASSRSLEEPLVRLPH